MICTPKLSSQNFTGCLGCPCLGTTMQYAQGLQADAALLQCCSKVGICRVNGRLGHRRRPDVVDVVLVETMCLQYM